MDSMTLDELLEAARRALQTGYSGPADTRAGRLPDRRAYRYYAAQGLLAPPDQLRGRVGLYSESHLHRLVALKRLQAQGHTLSEIREIFERADATTLEQLAQPPVHPRRGRRHGPRTLSELRLDAGLTLHFDPPVQRSRRLERQLKKAARSMRRSVRAARRSGRRERSPRNE